jgi:hypothetical protein
MACMADPFGIDRLSEWQAGTVYVKKLNPFADFFLQEIYLQIMEQENENAATMRTEPVLDQVKTCYLP